jgi:1,4-dihydroxy-2-naphthoate octaprenyltransferase
LYENSKAAVARLSGVNVPVAPLRVAVASSRPSQLLLVMGVYLFGVTIAVASDATLAGERVVLGAVPLFGVAASIHYANEYADHETDALTDPTAFSGGSGALVETDVPRAFVLRLALVALAAGLLAAGALALAGVLDVGALAVLVGATVLGWQYSVGPLRLAWRGWGEVTNAALGGLALPVYGAAVVAGPLATVALASLPFALLVLLNLFATQWPDRRADAAVGKRTLAVRWPARRLRVAYAGTALLAGGSLLLLHPAVLPTVVVLASLPVAPLVVWAAYGYTHRELPWPSVTAMVGLAVLQFAAWAWLAWG